MNANSTDLSEQPILISDEVIPFDAYQAIFYKLTKKVNQIRKIYYGGYYIDRDHIINLDSFIQQFIKQYRVTARNTEITHQIKNFTTVTYADLELFKLDGMITTEITSFFVYEFNFLVKLPQGTSEVKDIAQRYKLSIAIAQSVINDDELSPLLENFLSRPKIIMILDYVDFNISLSLQSTIDKWILTLQKEKERKITQFIIKNKIRLINLISTITIASPFIGAILLIKNYNYDVKFLFEISFLCIISSIFFRLITGTIINKIISYSSDLNPQMKINLTKGDKNRIKEINNKEKKLKKFLYFLIFGIFFTIVINFISSWIYTIL